MSFYLDREIQGPHWQAPPMWVNDMQAGFYGRCRSDS